MKKKYQNVKIKRIFLDPDQAIMQVCAIGGLYFSVARYWCVTRRGFGTDTNCKNSVKGVISGDSISRTPPTFAVPS